MLLGEELHLREAEDGRAAQLDQQVAGLQVEARGERAGLDAVDAEAGAGLAAGEADPAPLAVVVAGEGDAGLQVEDEVGDRLRLEIVYRVPDPQKVAPLVMHWDSRRLNSLSAVARNRLLENLDAQQRDGSLPMSDGRETFELRKENGQWRIYLDWSAGVKIPLRLELTNASGLEASLSKAEVSLQPGEVFDIKLRIKNATPSPVIARIGHLVEPHGEADYLDIVQCGFLLPVTIPPNSEQEYSGVYMLRGSLPERVRQLSLTYDFRILQ